MNGRAVGIPGAVLAAALALVVVSSSPARAVTCDPSYFPGLDNVFYPNLYSQISQSFITTSRLDQEATFWAGMGVLAFSSNSDYDINLYGSCAGGPVLASSAYGIGRTDFVIGDFNNDPLGYYAADIFCYGGACTQQGQYAAATWRSGGLLFVDFPPTTVNFTSYGPDMVMHVWDVYMSAGSTYYFQFSSTLGSNSKMLLFRNPSGGTYYAGRASAVFEVSGCTTYTAPTSGYYGLVVVNDVWSFGSSTVAVFSTPQCACADELPLRTPVTVPALPTTSYKWVTQNSNFWAAVGTRPAAGSDWDLEVSSSAGSPGCPQSTLATSTAGTGVADFVITDYNYTTVPATLAARTYRYSGGGGTTLEWDHNSNSYELTADGPQVTGSWGSDDVVQCWDVSLYQGEEYTFQFFASSNMSVLLFRNPGNGLFSTGRNGAVAAGASTFTYIAPSTGFYGVVVVKDDAQSGYFALRLGQCHDAYVLDPGSPVTGLGYFYYYLSMAPTAGRWTAVGSRSATADWDLAQYGSTAAAPWPDCASPTGVTSEAVSVPDFIVGDFHHNTPGVYPIRGKQYTSGAAEPVTFEWTGPAVPIGINSPAINDAPSALEVLRVYEAYLVGGWSYQIAYAQSATRPLLVFFNSTGTDFWAPRGAALLSTTTSTSFTPAGSGDYAFVIANDAAETGSFSLRISTTSMVDVGPGERRFTTAFGGAQPNPGRSDLALRYSLAAPGRVRFDLIDLSGRRVWVQDEGQREAGQWSTVLARRTPDLERIPAGLYFVKFEVNGQVRDVRKVTLLE